MRRDSEISLKRLCGLFGKTRHAWYEKTWQREEEVVSHAVIFKLIGAQRKLMPRIGTPKLYRLIKEPLQAHGIKIGRDKLHELLSCYGLTIKRKRRRIKTTLSRHWLKKYPNLVRDLSIERPDQVWVSDITYIRLQEGFCYLSLITDAYSRKIMGYWLSPDLTHQGCVEALRQALGQRLYPDHPLIHHSDRGVQYCCAAYAGLLHEQGIGISMSEKGDPYENALAERVNGILKDEFLLDGEFHNYPSAQKAVDEAVKTYNEHRPHASCDYLTPSRAYLKNGPLKRRWKNYYKAKACDGQYRSEGNIQTNAALFNDVDLWKTS